ncbi:MAG: DUF2723 domain-containing protein [bacterium]|nr:DUF2723 domain-containing protein [bacterium]
MLTLLFFVAVFYIHHLSPGVFGVDSGDFLTAAATGTIAHPPGYPLYILSGIISSYLPLAVSPAWKFGLVSVIASLGTLFCYYLILQRFRFSKLLSCITVAVLAFTYSFWLYAEVVEVFALYHFFLVLLFYLGLSYYQTRNIRYLFALSFCTGLSLTHQQAILSFLPILVVMVFMSGWRRLLNIKILLLCILFFFLGLLPYVYVLVSFNTQPYNSWLGANDPETLIRFMLRMDYGWIPTKTVLYENRVLALMSYGTYWLSHLPTVLLITMLVGVVSAFRKSRAFFFFIVIPALLTGPMFVFYSATGGHDAFAFAVVERFYLTSFILFLIFFPFGVVFIINGLLHIMRLLLRRSFAKKQRDRLIQVMIIIFVVVPVSLFVRNVSRTDMHELYMVDYFAKDVLDSLPKNSILFGHTDILTFSTLYLQYGLHMYEDITIPSVPRLKQLVLNDAGYKKTYERIKKDKQYKDELDVFLDSVLMNRSIRPVFSPAEGSLTDYSRSLVWMPYGLVLKASSKDELPSKEEYLELQKSFWQSSYAEKYHFYQNWQELPFAMLEIPETYSEAAYRQGLFLETNYNDYDAALYYYRKAFSINPRNADAAVAIGGYYLRMNDCKTAKQFIEDQEILKLKLEGGSIIKEYLTRCLNKKLK